MLFYFIQPPKILLFIGLPFHSLRSQDFYICKDVISLNQSDTLIHKEISNCDCVWVILDFNKTFLSVVARK